MCTDSIFLQDITVVRLNMCAFYLRAGNIRRALHLTNYVVRCFCFSNRDSHSLIVNSLEFILSRGANDGLSVEVDRALWFFR